MTYNLSDLLPYSDTTNLTSINERLRILQILAFYLQSIQSAIQKFLSHDYDYFDAQVSENLCQIRAYQLVQISLKERSIQNNLLSLQQLALEAYLKCKQLMEKYSTLQHKRPSHYMQEINHAITLQNFLSNNNIDLVLSNESYFLVQTFILSKYKLVADYEISQGINYEQLCTEIGVSSKTYIRKIIHRLQRELSKLSCQFIFELLSDLNANPAQVDLIKLLSCQDEVGRHVISCYEVTKVILQHALQKNDLFKITITRIAKNEKDSFSFFLNGSFDNFPGGFEDNKAIIFFHGIAYYDEYITESKEQYFEKFVNVGIEEIVLANMAQHPQYAGLLLNNKKYNPYQTIEIGGLSSDLVEHIKSSESLFLKHKFLSEIIGCNKKSANLFLLTHVRTSSAIKELTSVFSEPTYLHSNILTA